MRYFTFSLIFLTSTMLFAQTPDVFSYRAVIIGNDSLPLNNENIIVEIRIQDSNDDKANVEYEETHNLITTDRGGYHLKIGGGLMSKNFDGLTDVNWAKGEKFLNVRVFDVDGNLLSQGISQLMSVPYALFAKEVDSSGDSRLASEQINLSTLRLITGYSHGDLIYVKGHTIFGDGGQGYFIFNENYDYQENGGDDKGIIIKPDDFKDPSRLGRWLRLFDGHINVNFYGITGNTNPDTTISSISDRIQIIIDYAAANGRHETPVPEQTKGNTIYFPNGEYILDKTLFLRSGITIIGEGNNTLFTAAPNAQYDYMFQNFDPNNEADYAGLFFIHLEKFVINGRYCEPGTGCNQPASVGGIHFKAIKDSTGTGGFQRSKLKNIQIVNVDKNGIYLRGGNNGDNNFLEPNQHNVFENVIVQSKTDNGNSLRMEGQQTENIFIRCIFSGSRTTLMTVPLLVLDNVFTGGFGSGQSNQNMFLNCGFGFSEYGVLLKDSENITFESCWFENLYTALRLESAKKINILNSRFSNACGYGTNNPGYPITSDDLHGECVEVLNSTVNIERNYVEEGGIEERDSETRFIRGRSIGLVTDNTINSKDNGFQQDFMSDTYGILQNAQISSDEIDIGSKKLVFIDYDVSNNDLRKIKSRINGGEVVYLRANRTDSFGNLTIHAYTGATGENIYLAGQSSITLTNGEWISLIRVDVPINNNAEKGTFQLLARSN